MEKNLGNLPVTLTLCTPHHHPISINLMDSSRPWWRKSRMPTRKWMDALMLRLEHYSSYMTHPSWQTSHPQQRFYMVILPKEQSFQDHPKESIYIRSGKDLSNSKKNRKNTLTKPTEPKIYTSSKSRNKSSSSTTNKAQAPLSGQLAQWLKYWNVDDLTWSRPPTAESTEGTEFTWSPYVIMAPPFKTIWWKKARNSPKTFPFKTISPARPNPCLSMDIKFPISNYYVPVCRHHQLELLHSWLFFLD